MGKNVTVKFKGSCGDIVYRDLTTGGEYDAYMPEPGEVDVYGDIVSLHNEIWVKDDIGETVVTSLSGDWELI